MRRIHHLGVACKNISELLTALEISQEDISEVYEDHEQNNTLYFIELKENNLWLECVVPMNEHSTVWKFVKKNGIGLHHLGFESRDLNDEKQKMNQKEGAFEITGFDLFIKSFGGKIKTLFFLVKGLIVEYVYNK